MVDVGVLDEVHEEDGRLEGLLDLQGDLAAVIGGPVQALAALRVEDLLVEAGGVDGDLEDGEEEEEEGEGEGGEVEGADGGEGAVDLVAEPGEAGGGGRLVRRGRLHGKRVVRSAVFIVMRRNPKVILLGETSTRVVTQTWGRPASSRCSSTAPSRRR